MTNEEARELAQKACDALNSAVEADPAAMHALSAYRVPCNQALADHPEVVVDQIPVLKTGPYFAVGMVGVIVGILSAMGFPCVIGSDWSDEKDSDGRRKFIGFGIVELRQEAASQEAPADKGSG